MALHSRRLAGRQMRHGRKPTRTGGVMAGGMDIGWILLLWLHASLGTSAASDSGAPHLAFDVPDLAFTSSRHGKPYRCADLDPSMFAKGFDCGPPLGQPCFDFSRCITSSAGIYVHDPDCSLSDSSALLTNGTAEEGASDHLGWVFRNAALEAGVLAPTYESACIIMHVSTNGEEGCAVRSPLWNNGSNHVMVNFYDKGREFRPNVADSYAMDAASSMHSCLYRSGYDISLPLVPRHRFPSLADIPPTERNFFLTLKGSVYLSGSGSEERMSVVPLHDEANGVVMSMHCFEMHGEHLLPENVAYCESLRARYDDHDMQSLMNSTFGLVPAGRQIATYRLAETMSAGAIPVIVARDAVPPFREEFDWPSFSFWFAPGQVGPEMIATLRAVPRAKLEEMKLKSLEAFRQMFGEDDEHFSTIYDDRSRSYLHIATILVDILSERMEHLGGR